MTNIELLYKLLRTPSVSGLEHGAQQVFAEALAPWCVLKQDAMGNCYASLHPEASRMLMIEAHIDEIGFQVLYIDDNGYVYVRRNGGIDVASAIGSQVEICTRTGRRVTAVIGKRPIHLQTAEERKKLPELDELWLDTGLEADEVRQLVHVGDAVVFSPNAVMLGEHRIASKALDDKVGVWVVAEVMRRLGTDATLPQDFGVCGVATVQEEVGCKGAGVLAANVHPQHAISIDVGFSTDTPGMKKQKYGDVSLGNGVVVNCHTDCSPDMVRLAELAAGDGQVPYQLSANPAAAGGTDARPIQTSGTGISTLLLSIPNRYMHTQVEVCDLRDLQAAVDLILSIIHRLAHE